MLHTETVTAEELALIQKRKYTVLKTNLARVEGGGIVFTVEDTRIQLQAVITDVNTIFTSKQVISLEGLNLTGVENDVPDSVGGGHGAHKD